MQLGDTIALQACLSVSPSRAHQISQFVDKKDGHAELCLSCSDGADTLSAQPQHKISEKPHRVLSQASSALLFTQPLASSPPENPAPGLPLLRFIRESSDFLQLGTARQRSRRRKKNKRKRRRGSSDVPRGHTDDSEAHLDLLQPPEAAH